MREPLRDLERVKHIKEACRLLIEYHVKDSLETIKSNPIKFYGEDENNIKSFCYA